MREIFCVYPQIEAASPGNAGRCTEGFYTLENGVVTMTDPGGVPIRDIEGDKITHKLADDESAQKIAGRLTLKIFRSLRGDGAGGFNRPTSSLRYPRWVIS